MATQEQLDLREKWLQALESDEFTQTKNVLYNGTGYCCLGVACKVAGLEPRAEVYEEDEFGEEYTKYYFDNEEECLPANIISKYGFRAPFGNDDTDNNLASQNDGGSTFKQIAAFVRDNSKEVWLD